MYTETRTKHERALQRQKYLEKYPERVWEDYIQRQQNGTTAKALRKYFNETLKGWAARAFADIQKTDWKCSIIKQDLIDLYKRQKGLCSVTDMKMIFVKTPKCPARPSVDRIDRSKGYHLENIRLVWLWVNMARNVWSDKQLIACAKVLARHNYMDKVRIRRT